MVVTVGVGVTFTVAVLTSVQVKFFPVTVYVVLVVGLATGLEQLVQLNAVAGGDHT